MNIKKYQMHGGKTDFQNGKLKQPVSGTIFSKIRYLQNIIFIKIIVIINNNYFKINYDHNKP